jgi:GxxExxY protein
MNSINDLTYELNGAAMEVHRELGPGLLESTYEAVFCRELSLRGIPFVRQQAIPVIYKGELIDCGFRLDVIVDNRVIVELKSVERILPIHEAQILTYLKLSKLSLGLLINFNVRVLKDGIRRIANNLPDSPSASSLTSAVQK